MRTVGVEEEFLLVDPETRRLRAVAAAVVAAAPDAEAELQRTQVEIGTSPQTQLSDLRADLVRLRRDVAATARTVGVVIAATGAAPYDEAATITADERYEAMAEVYGRWPAASKCVAATYTSRWSPASWRWQFPTGCDPDPGSPFCWRRRPTRRAGRAPTPGTRAGAAECGHVGRPPGRRGASGHWRRMRKLRRRWWPPGRRWTGRCCTSTSAPRSATRRSSSASPTSASRSMTRCWCCLLYTSDAADEEDSVDLGG